MSMTLTYYLKICDLEYLEDSLGVDWKRNLTIEGILCLKNKINPFIFCEIVLLWILEVRPESPIISRLFQVMLSLDLSHWFYFDILSETFKIEYMKNHELIEKLSSVNSFKYHRQEWLLSGIKLKKFKEFTKVKISECCSVASCSTMHSVTIQFEPKFDTKIRVITDKNLDSSREHKHELYCHWTMVLFDEMQRVGHVWLSTSDFSSLQERLATADVIKIYSFLPTGCKDNR